LTLRDQDVFINCPFDKFYDDLFFALVFTIHALGFIPRCALESPDGSRPRLSEILRIIGECRFGIHDLSRNAQSPLPRFNMPFELGLFMAGTPAAEESGARKHCLMLERTEREYLEYISDLRGYDVLAHDNDPKKMVSIVRDWLRKASGTPMPGGEAVWAEYNQFYGELDANCEKLRLGSKENLIFVDLSYTARVWLEESRPATR
jgi:hypothetical protein